ncbi:MAG: DUF3343 domain-containing protein [Eubacteriales bacterium]|nr:DUF3343 domain-containing protein [Eubacteriales bacterium]
MRATHYLILQTADRGDLPLWQDYLKKRKIASRIISTPAAIAEGCGLCLRLEMDSWEQIHEALAAENRPRENVKIYRYARAATYAIDVTSEMGGCDDLS